MFTPAISASSTSPPPVIWVNAFSTQVTFPPFLYQLPFIEAITTGSAAAERRTAGASSARGSGAAATSPAAAPRFRKSRRDTDISIPGSG